MGWSVVLQRLTATTGVFIIFGGIALGAYKLRQSSDSLRGRGIYWRNQEMEDFVYCKEENLKRTTTT
uniref:NADH dehydrogenase [ubiquinone] 1 alpha subcomplex subunit 1 n=1 Tax=Elaeophora elaphi TaxID=1147741 RepID=A0A0R3RG87_9BILA